MENSSSSSIDMAAALNPEEVIHIITRICVPVVFSLIVLVGIFGNALVIIVVATNAAMRSTTNMLILNLAVADLLFIIACVPSTATDYVLNSWPFGGVWCQTVQYLIYATSYVSIYTLILMSIDRYMAVVFPVASLQFRTIKNACLAILILWSIIALATVPVWLSHQLERSESNVNNSSSDEILNQTRSPDEVEWCRFNHDDWSESGFQIAFFVSSYAIPLIMIILLYIGMLRRLWNPGSIGNKISKESLRNKRRVTKLVLVVIVVFCVCWAPIQIVLLLKAIGKYVTRSSEDYPRIIFQVFAHVLAYVNSCVNPILYAFLSDNFRKAFYNLMPCCMRISGGPTHPGHHALRYELTTMKSSTRGRRSLKDIRRRKKSSSKSTVKIIINDGIDQELEPTGINGLNQESTMNVGGATTSGLENGGQNEDGGGIEMQSIEKKPILQQHQVDNDASDADLNGVNSNQDHQSDKEYETKEPVKNDQDSDEAVLKLENVTQQTKTLCTSL